MSEQNPILLGTPVNVTVFIVDYQFTKAPRKSKLPKAAKAEEEKVQNRAVVCSGDPSGRDVFDIVQRLVLGAKPYDGSDFRVLNQQRVFDAQGLAIATSWDKLDGAAPLVPGAEVVDESEDDEEDGDGEDGSPPVSNLN